MDEGVTWKSGFDAIYRRKEQSLERFSERDSAKPQSRFEAALAHPCASRHKVVVTKKRSNN